MGKGYLQIDIDRESAARYGISVEDIQNEIEVALGRAGGHIYGRKTGSLSGSYSLRPLTTRDDEDAIRRLLVRPSSMAAVQRRWQFRQP